MLPVYSTVIADTMKRTLTGARATDPTVREPRRPARRRARTRVASTKAPAAGTRTTAPEAS